MIKGWATPRGTRDFAEKFKDRVRRDFYRNVRGLTLSTVGFGTHVGKMTSRDSRDMEKSLLAAIRSGINVIDTARNYGDEKCESIIGEVLSNLIRRGVIERNQIFVASKCGFLPRGFAKKGIVKPGEVVLKRHCLAAGFISQQIEKSRELLNLNSIDLYYVHNPETQRGVVGNAEFRRRLKTAFRVMAAEKREGNIKHWGISTWAAFLAGAEGLSMDELACLARECGDSFEFVQLPLSLASPDAVFFPSQDGKSALVKAAELGLSVFGSDTLRQGKITSNINERFDFLAPRMTDAVKAINFSRSTPGMSVSLVGMKKPRHLRENLKVAKVPRVPRKKYEKFFYNSKDVK